MSRPCRESCCTCWRGPSARRNILEIGTLGGYSTIWLARALPGRRPPDLAGSSTPSTPRSPAPTSPAPAWTTWSRCGSGRRWSRCQRPTRTSEPFDFVFIDADKPSNAAYFDWALRLSRPGSLIVVDNVVRGGDVIAAASDSPTVQGVRRFLERLAAEPRVSATAIQTVGSKGYDGFAIALVTSNS